MSNLQNVMKRIIKHMNIFSNVMNHFLNSSYIFYKLPEQNSKFNEHFKKM